MEQPIDTTEANDVESPSTECAPFHPIVRQPFYEKDGITIYHGDALEIVPELSGVNCVVTSPPYNQKIDGFKPSGMHKETNWISRIRTSYSDNLPEHVYQSQQSLLLAYLYEATTKDASVFYNHKIRWRNGEYISPLDWMRLCAWKIRQEIIWCRDGSVTMNAKMFPPSEERIVWLDKGKHKWNQECAKFLSTWKIKSEANSPHPVAYPLAIPMRCISATTDEGDLVLDPYMGSGTTLRAAKDCGRRAIGIEREERYCEIAANRLAQSVMF